MPKLSSKSAYMLHTFNDLWIRFWMLSVWKPNAKVLLEINCKNAISTKCIYEILMFSLRCDSLFLEFSLHVIAMSSKVQIQKDLMCSHDEKVWKCTYRHQNIDGKNERLRSQRLSWFKMNSKRYNTSIDKKSKSIST